MSNPANLQPFAQPNPAQTKFPIPRLVTGQGSAGETTSESFCLAGQQMPGQWLLTSVTREFGWQIKLGFGQTGANILAIGDPLCVAKFLIKIWTNADAAQYALLLKTILSKGACIVPGTANSAGMGIDQPQLLSIGVNTVVLKSITPLINPLVTSGGKGAWTAEAEFLEYRMPIPAIKSPDQRIPEKAPPVVTAKTAVQIENQRLGAVRDAKAKEFLQKTGWGPTP